MTNTLSAPVVAPAGGGPPKQLVVMLHGVGADGHDLIALAPHFAQALPEAVFVAPHAPLPYDMAPFGRQWFSLAVMTPQAIAAGVRMAAAPLSQFLDAELQRYGISDDALALVGFSQGAMMALHVATRRPRPCAAVLCYSGLLAAPETLAAEVSARPPVLLVHGAQDDVVPAAAMPAAAAALDAAGLPVETHLRPGLGHGIDETALMLGIHFLAQRLRPPF